MHRKATEKPAETDPRVVGTMKLPPLANSRSNSSVNLVVILLALIPSLVKLLYYSENIGSDDAYIHLQVARNVLAGHGWSLNADTPVNMSSSPAFTILLILVSALTVHAIPVVQILSCLASALGLLLIYGTVRSETGSERIGLISELSAAFSCDLWRWNGTVMEASITFLIVALLLFLFRRRQLGLRQEFCCGVVAGLAVLLRPELLLAVAFCAALSASCAKFGRRTVSALILLIGSALIVTPWLVFARLTFHSFLPTTFYAKSVPSLILWNPVIVKQMLELAGESFLWPTLLIAALIIRLVQRQLKVSWRSYRLPGGLFLGVLGFYYLKTPGLESPGRYMLPLLPCAAVLLGLVVYDSTFGVSTRRLVAIAAAIAALQSATSLAINQIYLAPTLQRFESEYGETMHSAANFIASRVQSHEETVLAVVDVGVLAYAADGRFRIYDGGGLASPELIRLSTAEQVQRVQPNYLIESQGDEAGEWDGKDGGRLCSIWYRKYRQHSVSQTAPYLFANVYRIR
jgi:hypothetical protein